VAYVDPWVANGRAESVKWNNKNREDTHNRDSSNKRKECSKRNCKEEFGLHDELYDDNRPATMKI
jgi:hypothetical protein